MKIAIFGTGYVGLVTGVCLSDIGHKITCIDIDKKKVEKMKDGISPIYEPGLDKLMQKNIKAGRLSFTTKYSEVLKNVDLIYIAVGTPQKDDGSANLQYIEQVALEIAGSIEKDMIIVTKSTVPVGTNDYLKDLILTHLKFDVKINMVSNPEFLREGSAIQDSFHGDRIVIGADSEEIAKIVQEVNKPFRTPIFQTTIRSAELIKYASNAFLATKISFINEISNICEKVNANVEDVAYGMGLDKRIGTHFLKAGIGYGGSCFPKDTHALIQIAGNVDYEFELLKSVIRVNNKQRSLLVQKAKKKLGNLAGKQVAILGLAFKPNTDDIREAASIGIARELVAMGAVVKAYDPVAMNNAAKFFPSEVEYTRSIDEAIQDADVTFILTEWDEIKNYPLSKYVKLMEQANIFDGRNCYDLNEVKKFELYYSSIGRLEVTNKKIMV
ncbi:MULTISPECIES: UDP-glucose dehydrogenase family protein [Bacillus]|uniref:UDP-glucose 6-dehydrogenase n=3 Tax=Bacillus cereus group TaxID=86661 RepID=A0A9W5KR52_BACCE|nr:MULTISPECIES: UDP-glucose/GDP-mannose dehydrogenase family protein [Bacillus cereus group]EKS8366681.1 UDP-glucose/GDP-mannose dehydrogenase family protein [Bacillus cereus]AHA75389.1 UDP-glucose 6-dehydrogenase [Bacillus thuringiensis YBT-1518]EEM44487.1 NDP-sugar dehydrogenase (Teichuronic acid biosynthesis) [Bacillus thuringiensis serovar pakistani str. T13001]EJR62194.1 nucleotide sugar dehydrogenase [Bacillus cereus VD154]EKS8372222.1 UDP-glucose/GDP-mannose dehydrogenase family protei